MRLRQGTNRLRKRSWSGSDGGFFLAPGTRRRSASSSPDSQRGLHSGANTALQVGRLEHEVLRFHRNIAAAIDGTLVPAGGEAAQPG